jgi:hypothetical protein
MELQVSFTKLVASLMWPQSALKLLQPPMRQQAQRLSYSRRTRQQQPEGLPWCD